MQKGILNTTIMNAMMIVVVVIIIIPALQGGKNFM